MEKYDDNIVKTLRKVFTEDASLRNMLLQHAPAQEDLQGMGKEKDNEKDNEKENEKDKEQDKDQDKQQTSDGKEAADNRNVD